MTSLQSRFDVFPGDARERRVDLVLTPVDAVSGKRGGVRLRVRIGALDRKAIRNLSGDYCFLDLPAGDHEVELELADDHGRYLAPSNQTLLVPRPDTSRPAVDVPLFPGQAYPFEATATPVRGVVRSVDGVLAGVDVRRAGEPELLTRTGADGRFVLDARPATKTETQTYAFTKDGASAARSVAVHEGRTTNLGEVFLLQ